MSELEDIKDRIDIVELISSYLTLNKAGRNYKANCPFHNEKTPSFMVSPDKQIWHCFGCQKGGDVFGFVMEMEGMDFPEALRFLAKKAGVELKAFSKNYSDKKNVLYEINQAAASFYHNFLMQSQEAEVARNYLKKRGIKEETILDFKLGYAPPGFDKLMPYLKSKEYEVDDIVKAGLAIKKDSGKVSDRFYKRLLFPIANPSGAILGFTGRVLGEENVAKYINTSETPIYEKSRAIFGIDKAKKEITARNWVVVVEGNMDVLASYQAGVKNVVASSGTALTSQQLRILQRYTSNIILALDKDNAGKEALKRGVFLALEEDMNIKVAELGDFKDPDEMIKKDHALWKKSLKKSKPFMDFYLDQFFGKVKGQLNSVLEKKRIAREALPFIKRIQNEIEKTHYIQVLSQKLNVPEASITDALRKTKEDKNIRETPASLEKQKKETNSLLEETLLGLMISYPSTISEITDILSKEDFSNDENREIFEKIKENNKISKEDFSQELKPKISELMFIIEETHKESDDESIFAEAKFCYKRIKELDFSKKKRELSAKLKEAEEQKNAEKTEKYMQEFQALLLEEKKLKEF